MFLQLSNFFLLRTTVKTIEHLPSSSSTSIEDATRLLVKDEEFMESLFLSSPDLYKNFLKISKNQQISAKEKVKVLTSVYKYLVRSCTRPTPFGLFAGYAYGHIRKVLQHQISIQTAPSNRRHIRLNMEYIVAISEELATLPQVRNQIKYYINNSCYRKDGKIFYVDFSVIDFSKQYQLSSLESSDYLDQLLDLCVEGAFKIDMKAALQEFTESTEDANAFIEELIDNKVIVSDLEPSLVGLNNLNKIISVIAPLKSIESIRGTLLSIQKLLDSSLNLIYISSTIKELLSSFLSINLEKPILHVDLELDVQANILSENELKKFQANLEDIFLAFSTPVKNPRLEEFISAYTERYEGKEMPLSEVLDPIYGIGYDSSSQSDTLEDSDFIKHVPEIEVVGNHFAVDELTRLRMNKLHESLQSGKTVVEISNDELERLKKPISEDQLPNSFYVFGSLQPDLNKFGKSKLILRHFIGSSGANLISRFEPSTHRILEKLKKYIKKEESYYKDQIYAEIVHLPQPKVANILLRPQLREYEIPYLASSNLATDKQIPIRDLMVSVIKGKVTLRSKQFNKIVAPRLTTAHIYQTGLSFYKFLGDIQKQQVFDYNVWNWNELSDQDFLPRLEYRNITLSLATWRIEKRKLNHLKTEDDFFTHLIGLRPEVPKQVYATEADQEMFIDLDIKLSRDLLWQIFSKSEIMILKECITTPTNSLIKSERGFHFHEVVIPYYKQTGNLVLKKSLPNKQKTRDANMQSAFCVGSEWIYFKVYCSSKIAEQLLLELKPLFELSLEEKLIDQWFYIKFQDSGHHLRIRLHGLIDNFYCIIIKKISVILILYLNSGAVSALKTDKYVRELGRYSSTYIAIFEEVSFHDSMTCLETLTMLTNNGHEQIRWLIIIKGIDQLFNDLRFTVEQKLEHVSKYKTLFFKEFKADNSLNKLLNGQYRSNYKLISDCLHGVQDEDNEIQCYNKIFQNRSSKLSFLVKALCQKSNNTNIGYKEELYFSIIHLFINRMIKSEPRKHELVFYHHLENYYSTQIHKLKKAFPTDA